MIEINKETTIFNGVDTHEFFKAYKIKDIEESVQTQILQDQKLRELVEDWATDESYSWSETCKELLEESKK